jgi:hypothetical protein
MNQETKKLEALTIDLDKLPRCSSCNTLVKTEGLCNFCRKEELYKYRKDILIKPTKEVLSKYKQKIMNIFKTCPKITCDVCGEVPKGYGDRYLIFKVDKTICNRCNQNVHR